jgi:hypothetical protein
VDNEVEIVTKAIALVLVACLPHGDHCISTVQHPAPISAEECNLRAITLTDTLAGSIDDAGYRPLQVICLYGDAEQDNVGK